MSTLVKSNSFPFLQSSMDDFWSTDKFFARSFSNQALLPAVNIRDTKNNYELEVAAPGFKKADFKITTDNGLLTISAETTTEESEENGNYTRKEFSKTSFSRTFNLPDNVIEDNIKARYQDGLLTVDLKKSATNFSQKKEVKVE